MIKFKDKALEAQFEKDGFVTFPLLSPEQVEQLRNLYFANRDRHLTHQGILHSTSDTNDYGLIGDIDRSITAIMKPAVDKVLLDYEPLIAGFLTKEKGEVSATEFHQDPTLVDETKFVSANVWVALQDTDSNNGNLRVVKGSHRMKPCIRATPDCPMVFQDVKEELIYFATEVPVKAGHAVLLNHQSIHGANHNHSGMERIAIAMAVKPKEAAWCFYFLEPGADFDKFEKFEIDSAAFASMVKYERPSKGRFLRYETHSFDKLTKVDLLRFMCSNYLWEALKGATKMIFKIR